MKTLENTSMELKNSTRTEVFGNPGAWVCICKAWNKDEGWMKSTKAMDLGHGCLVQVSTQQQDMEIEGRPAHVAEAVTFVPGITIGYYCDGKPILVQRA